MTAKPWRCTYGTASSYRKGCWFGQNADGGSPASFARSEPAVSFGAERVDHPALYAGKTASWSRHSLAAAATT